MRGMMFTERGANIISKRRPLQLPKQWEAVFVRVLVAQFSDISSTVN